MNAAQRVMPGDAPPVFEWPVLLALLPGIVSAVAALMGMVSLEWPLRIGTVPAVLLHLQGSLLALAAGALAEGVEERLRGWEGRAAPCRARDRIRASLRRWLAGLLTVGLAGPLILAAVLACQAGSAQPLLGSLAVLAASTAAGLCLVLGWRGRLPRGVMIAAAALLLALLIERRAVEAVSGDGLLAALALGLAGLGFWRAALAKQALAACVAPMPVPRLGPWWRRFWTLSGWERVPEFTLYRTMSGWAWRPSTSSIVWMSLAWLPQGFIQRHHVSWLDWGESYEHMLAAAGFGAWLLLMAVLARACQIAPALNWRRRLAPRGLTAERWATQLVLGSMLTVSLSLTLLIALSALANAWTTGQPFSVLPCLSALGDVVLASAWMAYVRGRDDSSMIGFVRLLAACLAAVALLAVLPWLGVIPRRGPLWLGVELALGVVLGRAAIRVWAKRDLNALARTWA
ncbi:MAG TPA: hypothetical protein VIN58_22700 [Roseateles sp.]